MSAPCRSSDGVLAAVAAGRRIGKPVCARVSAASVSRWRQLEREKATSAGPLGRDRRSGRIEAQAALVLAELLAVHQPTLRAESSRLRRGRRRPRNPADIDKGHGRIEERRTSVLVVSAGSATAASPASCVTGRRPAICASETRVETGERHAPYRPSCARQDRPARRRFDGLSVASMNSDLRTPVRQDESHSQAQRQFMPPTHARAARDRADFGRGQSAVAQLELAMALVRMDSAGFFRQPLPLRVAEHQQHHLAHVHGDSRPALLLHCHRAA